MLKKNRFLISIFTTCLMTAVGCSSTNDSAVSSSSIEPSSSSRTNTKKYKEEVNRILKHVDDIPTLNEIMSGDDASKKPSNNLMPKRIRDEKQGVYDYTTFQEPDISTPCDNICLNDAVFHLFDLDGVVDECKATAYLISNSNLITKYNNWELMEDTIGSAQYYTRVRYNSAFNNVVIEEKGELEQESWAYYKNFIIGQNSEEKTIMLYQLYETFKKDDETVATNFQEINYVEDSFFRFFSSETNEGDYRPLWINYGEINFKEKLFKAISENKNIFDSNLDETEYFEIPYGEDILASKHLCWPNSVFDKKFTPIIDASELAISLYYLDGVESIISEKEITYDDCSREWNTIYNYNLPITIKTKNGKTITNSSSDLFKVGVLTYMNFHSAETVVVPMIVLNKDEDGNPIRGFDGFRDVLKELENEYGLTPKEEIQEPLDTLLGEKTYNPDYIERGKELRMHSADLYQPVDLETMHYYMSDQGTSAIAKGEPLEEISTTFKGEANISEEGIDFTGMSIEIEDCALISENEEFYVDYFLKQGETKYQIGFEKINYQGKKASFDLKSIIKLEKNFYHQGDYDLVIALRNRAASYHIVKVNEGTPFEGTNFKYSKKENGELLINVTYAIDRKVKEGEYNIVFSEDSNAAIESPGNTFVYCWDDYGHTNWFNVDLTRVDNHYEGTFTTSDDFAVHGFLLVETRNDISLDTIRTYDTAQWSSFIAWQSGDYYVDFTAKTYNVSISHML